MDNSPFSHDFEKEKSHRNQIARTEESESPIPFERAAEGSAMRCSYTKPCVRYRYIDDYILHDLLMATPMFKSNAVDQKVCKKRLVGCVEA